MSEAPERLDAALLKSEDPVYPAFVDKLRVVVQKKLGWEPLPAREFFAPHKEYSRKGKLTKGELLCFVKAAHGDEAALVVARALWWFENEPTKRKESNASVRSKYKRTKNGE